MKLLLLLFINCVLLTNVNGGKDNIIVLNENNWRESLTGEWMIKFYAPWCPACQANEGDYAAFADWSDDLNIKVAIVDITQEPGLSGRFMVTALPTFYHGLNGEFRRYSGSRTSESMHDYIEEKHWIGVDPVWWMRHPASPQMTLMSWLFKTSILMKNVHEALTETYGLSTWMSYAVFGVGTLITGLALGLVLVCIVDCISPPKRLQPQTVQHIPEDMTEESKSRNLKRPRDSESEDTQDEEEEEGEEEEAIPLSQLSSRSSKELETLPDVIDADAASETQLRKRNINKVDPDTKEAGDAPGLNGQPE